MLSTATNSTTFKDENWLRLFPTDTNTALIDNPKSVLNLLYRKQWNETFQELDQLELILSVRSQDNNPRKSVRWVGSNVGKIQIQRKQDSRFLLADVGHGGIVCAL